MTTSPPVREVLIKGIDQIPASAWMAAIVALYEDPTRDRSQGASTEEINARAEEVVDCLLRHAEGRIRLSTIERVTGLCLASTDPQVKQAGIHFDSLCADIKGAIRRNPEARATGAGGGPRQSGRASRKTTPTGSRVSG